MAFNHKIARLSVFSLTILTCMALAVAAFAQDASLGKVDIDGEGECEEEFTIPLGTDPGIYDVEVTGEVIVEDDGDYPADSPSVSTDENVLFPGEEFTLFCEGFAPNTEADVDLELVRFTEATFSQAQATETRTVSTRIRVIDPDDVEDDDDFIDIIDRGDRTIVVNNSSSASSSAAAAASGGGDGDVTKVVEKTVVVERPAITTTTTVQKAKGVLARTGVDALPVAAAALATILLGTVLLGAARRKSQASDT